MAADHNISTHVELGRVESMIMAALIAIALYNVVELTFIISIMFKRRNGLYFWSFVVATWSVAPYTAGFIMKFFAPVPSLTFFYVTLIGLGWCGMVTGQSVVLYSRLHLVLRDPKVLRLVLAMIIVDALICHVPTLVMVYGANSNNPEPFVGPYSIYEKIQITIFFLQESTISGLYIYSTYKILKPAGNARERELRKTMTQLIWINAMILVLDLTILGMEYSGHYEIQVVYKGALYSVKLKVEFRILNQLMDLTKAKSPRAWSKDDTHSGGIVGTTQRERQSNVYDLDNMGKFKGEALSRQKSHLTSGNYAVKIGADERGSPDNRLRMEDGIGITTKFEVEHEVREARYYSDSERGDESRGAVSETDEGISKDETDSRTGFSKRGA